MAVNVGKIDRIIRALIGLGILALIFVIDGNARWWGLVGIIPLVRSVRILPSLCPTRNRYLRNDRKKWTATEDVMWVFGSQAR